MTTVNNKKTTITSQDVLKFKEEYLEIKKAYLENISTQFIQDMLKDAPANFKKFIYEKNIQTVEFVNDVYSEDYMPDWAHLIVFADSQINEYAFVQNCSETYKEVQSYSKEIYFTESDINEEIFEYVQSWCMKIFQAFNL